jgi:Smg protein
MKENIFDVLMYLFENYMEDEIEMLPDSDVIRTELLEAGFESCEVNKAFDWLDSLTLQRTIKPTVAPAFRIFCAQEIEKLDLECRNLIMFLEQNGILNSANREIVIDRAMALENEEISMEKLKWIVLMVLLSQPDEEIAFSRMEDIVYDLVPTYLH